jgi:hypothetical protein
MAVETNPRITGVSPFTYSATSITVPSGSQLLFPNGTAALPSVSFTNDPDTGIYWDGSANHLTFAAGAAACMMYSATNFRVRSDMVIGWSAGTDPTAASYDVALVRDAAAVLAVKNGTTAQALRVYGTTTGPVYLEMLATSTLGEIRTNTGDLYLGAVASAQVQLYTNSTVRWIITSGGGFTANANLRFSHGASALATGATEGFFHIQSCAGTPSGTPASIPTGQIPMIYDSSAHKIWFYSGSWRGVTVS